MAFDYFYGTQADQFNFIKIPKLIITDKTFEGLTVNAKLLYGVLLDRMNLSMKNGWLDEENRVYIIYQVAEIMEDFSVSKTTAVKYLNELEEFGLVEKRRRGLGMASLLYVKSFMTNGNTSEKCTETLINKRGKENLTSRSKDNDTSRGKENCTLRSQDYLTSRSPISKLQEVKETAPHNKTYINNNNINNTKQSNTIKSYHINEQENDMMGLDARKQEIKAYEMLIKENIEYDVLIDRYNQQQDVIDGIVNIMLETVVCENDYIIISSNRFPKEVVKSQLLKLNMSHIEYVLSCMRSNTTRIGNIKKYLLASLYNAPNTITSYYQSMVNHDMPQYAQPRNEKNTWT